MGIRFFVLRRFCFLVTIPVLLLASLAAASASPSSRKKPVANSAKQHVRKPKAKTRATPEQRRKLRRAFVASADLKPMAKQLLSDRTPAAYSGVEHYALRHRADDGGTLAHLVLGYAHLQDHDYEKATKELKLASARGGELADYSDYFLALSVAGGGDQTQAANALKSFVQKHPDSLFRRQADLMRAAALVSIGQPDEAVRLLETMRDGRADVELALGRAYVAAGQPEKAMAIWNRIYIEMPTSAEAPQASAELAKIGSTGVVVTPTLEQRQTRADLLMKSRRYEDAATEYRAILDSIRSDVGQSASGGQQRALQVNLAGALYHTHRLDEAKSLLDSLPEGQDEIEAQRLYYLHEIARSKDDGDKEREFVSKLMQKFPASPWLQEALLSASNMYMLRPDYNNAIEYYGAQYKLFPEGRFSPYSHWKAAWMNLRAGNRAEAERLMEEQIAMYPAGQEVPPALYWRARLAEEDGDRDRAGEYYTFILRRFSHYYYADLARERLRFHFDTSKHDSLLDKIPPDSQPTKDDFEAPPDDLRVARAGLLSNAALFDFAIRELQSEPDKLYAKGEIARIYMDEERPQLAIEALKRAVPGYFTEDIADVPQWAWDILFPKPYWNDLTRYARANGLDPYLVASLIRQESEFNPTAVSRQNAWGLMQLLPSNGKRLAKELKIRHFNQEQLTNPTTNLAMGTRYFKHMIDDFGGQVEYALAAYNAGSDRVKNWKGQGQYRDIYEFVESIPFTETREYVQAIMRNATLYRLLYSGETKTASVVRAARREDR